MLQHFIVILYHFIFSQSLGTKGTNTIYPDLRLETLRILLQYANSPRLIITQWPAPTAGCLCHRTPTGTWAAGTHQLLICAYAYQNISLLWPSLEALILGIH